MKTVRLLLLIVLLISAILSPIVCVRSQIKTDPSNPDLFFGVSFGGKTTSEAKLLIDKVKGYTNVFIVDSWDISGAPNETALDEICQYAVDAKMSIMVYFDMIFYNYTRTYGTRYNSTSWTDYGVSPWHMSWLNSAREKWGNKFLGVYLYDEPGGKQIDTGYWRVWDPPRNVTTYVNVTDYSDAANRYVTSILHSGEMQRLTNSSVPGSIPNSTGSKMPVFTSDYALYWFDYQAGYDVLFAEIGDSSVGMNSKIQQISLCRGAAKMQNKEWGAIITWGCNVPPYLETGKEMLQDMIMAYEAGAKYLIVFNYPQICPYGALAEEHFTAMETFWNLIHHSPRNVFGNVESQVAFVLPADYGWGLRYLDDKIWGLWPPDDLSSMIWNKMTTLIQRYGSKLDIIYDDPQFRFEEKYTKIFFWNSSI
jgi:hypothetical protein